MSDNPYRPRRSAWFTLDERQKKVLLDGLIGLLFVIGLGLTLVNCAR